MNQHINSQNNRWPIDPYVILMPFIKGLDMSAKLQCGASNKFQTLCTINPNHSVFNLRLQIIEYNKLLIIITEKMAFSWRTEKAIFQNPKKIAFSWRTEKAIFRKQKKLILHGALKKRFFGYRIKSLFRGALKKRFFGNRKNGFFVAH